MKEKIGLLTIHDTINYGSLLQTFATYAAIEKLGYEVEVMRIHIIIQNWK